MKNRDFPTDTIQKFLKQFKRLQPLISVVIVVHNMQRVAPRTLQSFTSAYQDMAPELYEVIVVENGSDRPLSRQQVEAFGPNFRYFSLRDASPSPVGALNFGVKQSKGRMVALMIDGAHLVTPGVLKYALRALRAYTNPVISILALHLGPQLQRLSIKDGYSEEVEDGLLQQIDWPKAGYKLFTISSLLKGTNDGGWFLPMNESNCVFLLRCTYDEIGGFDERFDLPGGGLANLDFYLRVCEYPTTELIILLGEGSFHQIHGGVATNNANDQTFHDSVRHWMEQYKAIRGKNFKPSTRKPEYWGDVVPEVIPFLDYSIHEMTANKMSVEAVSTRIFKETQDEQLAIIRSSGLFDEKWYLVNNPDVAQAKMDPVFHYLLHGGYEGRDPGPNFSSNWYLHTHKDVSKAGVNPLVHYLKYGREEARAAQPNQEDSIALIRSSSLFDEAWYLDNNPDVYQAKMDPVFHYLQFGGFEGRDPSPNFSSKWYLHAYKDAIKAGVNPLVDYLRYGLAEGRKIRCDPILVYTMAKVGSTTVAQSLLDAYRAIGIQVPFRHAHLLNGLDTLPQKVLQEIPNPIETLNEIAGNKKVRDEIDENLEQHWNIISLVRDPVARNVSGLFHTLSSYFPNWRQRYADGTLSVRELQEWFVTTGIIDEIPNQWFDKQVKQIPAFGIDVYAEPFPKEIGYKIYPGASRARLLLIRLENLNECAGRAMHEFLGLENFTLHNTNVAEDKEYADLYRAFKNRPLPVEYVQRIYNTQVARHFYTDTELLGFAKRWTGVDKLELARDS